MPNTPRTPGTDTKRWLIATAIILVAGLLDFLFENVSILYLLPALFVARYVRGRGELLCYALLALIVFLAPWLAGTNRLSDRGILNRSMGLVMGMCMAYVIRERQGAISWPSVNASFRNDSGTCRPQRRRHHLFSGKQHRRDPGQNNAADCRYALSRPLWVSAS